jgi:putative membrane protein
MRRQALIALAVVALTAGPALAQTKTAKAKTSRASSDEMFVKNTAKDGMAEVELGKLAAEKASNADVKSFAERMVSDHTKANDELKQVAAKKNITLPADPDAKAKAKYDRLSKLSGPAFDRAYMNEMLAGHKKAVAAFGREAKNGTDPDIKMFASSTLPTLQDHLKMAQNADKEVIATAGSSRAKGKKTGTSGAAGTNAAPAH